MIDLYKAFSDLPVAGSAVDFSAIELSERRRDFLAKGTSGSPVFLLHDASAASYSPAIELRNLSAQFHNTCRVTTAKGVIEDQFAVVSCNAEIPELYELFVRCIAVAVEQLPTISTTSDLQGSIQELLNLFRALNRPSSKEVTGLWAELFVLSKTGNVALALKAWHANQFERFDFSWTGGCLEVKATVKELRQHEFALEQLRAPIEGRGLVASFLLQPMTGGAGVIDLAKVVDAAVVEPQLRQKLWENVAAALGSDFSSRLDRRFDPSYAQRHLAIFAMSDIPAPDHPADPRVTAIRFVADLSSVPTSTVGAAIDVLKDLIA